MYATLCLTEEQTTLKYASVAPGASAQLERSGKERSLGLWEKLKERQDFYRASKEIMQEVNLATKGQFYWRVPHPCSRLATTMGPEKDVGDETFMISTASHSQYFVFPCLEVGNRGQVCKMKKRSLNHMLYLLGSLKYWTEHSDS